MGWGRGAGSVLRVEKNARKEISLTVGRNVAKGFAKGDSP